MQGGSPWCYVQAQDLDTGVWYFVVAWHDAKARSLNLTVNNGPVKTTLLAAGHIPDTSAGYSLGKRYGDENYMYGYLDEAGLLEAGADPC